MIKYSLKNNIYLYKLFNVSLVLFILFFLVTCQKNSSQKSEMQHELEDLRKLPSKGVKLIYTIGGDSINILYNISSIFIHHDLTTKIYALDRGLYQIRVFNENLQQIKSVGAKGSGPAEFKSPVVLGGTENFLIVSEQFSPRGHLFDMNLEYKKDIYLEIMPVSIAGYQNDQFLITGASLSDFGSIEVGYFNLEPPIFHTLQVPYLDELPDFLKNKKKVDQSIIQIWKFCNITAYDNKIWIASIYQNRILCIEQDTILWKKSLNNIPKYADVSNDSKYYLPVKKIIKDITVDKQGSGYVLIGDYGKNPERTIVVLGKKGEEIDMLILPYKTFSIQWSPPDKLFSIDENRIKIRCYKIISEKLKNVKK